MNYEREAPVISGPFLTIPDDGGPATLGEGVVLYHLGGMNFILTYSGKRVTEFGYAKPDVIMHLVTPGQPPEDLEWLWPATDSIGDVGE